MKKLIAFYLIINALPSFAQKNIDGLVNAEKSFAAYSVEHGTREAFLKFLDSNGVVFDGGKAVNGIESWNKKKNGSGILNWHPQYAEIALSDDWGYTTGPWTFQPKTINDSIVGKGQYITVWHIAPDGQWKFLVDLGIGRTPLNSSTDITKIAAKKAKGKADTETLLTTETNFITAFNDDRTKAYQTYLSGESILNRNGFSPANNEKDRKELIEKTPSAIKFTIAGSGIASSGDLAYVYGNTVLNDKAENYLHIWRREKEGWKLALEVLRY